jgi:hypothetical protein
MLSQSRAFCFQRQQDRYFIETLFFKIIDWLGTKTTILSTLTKPNIQGRDTYITDCFFLQKVIAAEMDCLATYLQPNADYLASN